MSEELRSINHRIERLRNILNRAIKTHKILTEISMFQSDVEHGRFLAGEHQMMIQAYSDFFEKHKNPSTLTFIYK